MNKSPIDELFKELYGYYPNKAGQAYELLVAAAIKVITGINISYDQHHRGQYSQTDYQVDAVIPTETGKQMVEVKDYTIDKRKVGRSDLQKLQGALTDLDFEKGLFVSATDYTKPAKKYSDSSEINPLQKVIDLLHIRPSTELDEKGRIKKFEIDLTIIIPDYNNGLYQYAWTKESEEKIISEGLIGRKVVLDRFYKSTGELDCLLEDFTYYNQPVQMNMDDEFSLGCWLLPNKYVKLNNELFELKGIAYKIPYRKITKSFMIESEGVPRILIKSEDGKIDKLLTDEDLRKITFNTNKIL